MCVTSVIVILAAHSGSLFEDSLLLEAARDHTYSLRGENDSEWVRKTISDADNG